MKLSAVKAGIVASPVIGWLVAIWFDLAGLPQVWDGGPTTFGLVLIVLTLVAATLMAYAAYRELTDREHRDYLSLAMQWHTKSEVEKVREQIEKHFPPRGIRDD